MPCLLLVPQSLFWILAKEQSASNTAQRVPSEVAKEQSVAAAPDPKGNSLNLTDPATCTSSDPVPAMPTKHTCSRVMKPLERFNDFVS